METRDQNPYRSPEAVEYAHHDSPDVTLREVIKLLVVLFVIPPAIFAAIVGVARVLAEFFR